MPCLDNVLSLDQTLGKKERSKRTLFFAFNVSLLSFALVYVAIYYQLFMEITSSFLTVGMLTCSCVLGITVVLCRCKLSTPIIVGIAYTLTFSLIIIDLQMRVMNASFWAPIVLVVDFMLVMQVPSRYSVWLVCVVLCWLVFAAAETNFRFGLFDLPGLPPQGGSYGRERWISDNQCDTLPCTRNPALPLLEACMVFVIDFIATRGFARDILKEQATMERTISAVQEIASLLAGYDVDGVAQMLEEQRDELPEEMHATLRRMEENLRKYRPYLPAALFEDDGDTHMAVPPPVLENNRGTIVFTDIRSSTSIWECAPEGMRAGLKIHNAVMREAIQDFCGYEVKTIGDAFMVAFATTVDGVNFALQVQERLLKANWPVSLLEGSPICAAQSSLWGGLTVRIGVNTGPVNAEQSTLTGRTDYFGHTVNVAARLESTCKPGAVAIPSDLWASVCGRCTAFAGQVESLNLKGVSQAMDVCCLWPVLLAGRERKSLESVNRRKSGVSLTSCVSGSLTLGSQSFTLSEGSLDAHAVRQVTGTVGVVNLEVGEEGHSRALHSMNAGLATLTIALDQSGGSLVTLLGSCVCVGWNVTRSAPAHMENAIRFAQRMMTKTVFFKGAGLASGSVQHGDIGSHKQRFVTVLGRTVRRSWTLCEEAVSAEGACFYEPGGTVPSALESALLQHKVDTYRVVQKV